jgi:uncharacterized membrane protein
MAETRLDQPRGVRRTGPRYDAEAFGRFAETIARFIGTARFLVLQTAGTLWCRPRCGSTSTRSSS